MNIKQKLGIGFGISLFLLVGFSLLPKPVKAVISGPDGASKFTFVDRSTIIGTINGTDVIFTNPDPLEPYDNQTTYIGDYQGCEVTINLPKDWTSNDFRIYNLGRFPTTVNKDHIHLMHAPNGGDCVDLPNIGRISDADQGARAYFAWVDTDTIVSVDHKDTFKKKRAGEFWKEGETSCVDRIYVSDNKGVYFEFDKNGYEVGAFPQLKGKKDISKDCNVYGVNYVQGSGSWRKNDSGCLDNEHFREGRCDKSALKRLAGLMPNIAPKPQPPAANAGNAQGNNDNSCEANYNGPAHEFNWIFCGVLSAFNKMFETFNGFIKDQLNFCTGDSSTTDQTCKHNLLTPEVNQAWSIFRIIASALLVIVMLIMVLSQALGVGPFDAYTVRKLLPKLVAAVIIMQISWYLVKYAIDLSNDVGKGIYDLMVAPFGGSGKLDLDNQIATLGNWAPGVTIATLFTGIVAWGAFSGLTIFGVALLGLSAIASVIVAVLVLLFRQILIIMCVILVPVALVAWILPGTQRYWKLWSDNFLKLLFMFPLIMALIAGGRIFANIGGGSYHNLLGLLIVLVGLLGPYWLLPKTFQWGGQAFGALAKATWTGSKSLRNYPASYSMTKAKENRGRRGELRAARLADEPNNRRFADRLLSGEFNFARQRGHGGHLGGREMEFAKTLAEGEKTARESVPAQLLRTGYDSMRHGPAVNARGERIYEGQAGYEINKLDALQSWLEGRTYAGVTPDAAMSGHAFDTLTTLGDPDRLRMARATGRVDEQVWSKGLARNFPKLNETARYLTLTPDLSNLSPRQLTSQDDDTAQELERQLRGHYTHNRETGGGTDIVDPQEQRAQLERAATLAVEAHNSITWTDMTQAKRRVAQNILVMAREAGIDVEGMALRAGVRLSETPQAPDDAPPPDPGPEPPEGGGPEEDEREIRVDH